MKKCLKLFEEYCQNAVSKENFNSDGTILDMSKIIQQKIEFLKSLIQRGRLMLILYWLILRVIKKK